MKNRKPLRILLEIFLAIVFTIAFNLLIIYNQLPHTLSNEKLAKNSGDSELHTLSNMELARKSVTITNNAKNSGGSGVILLSEPTGSYILTNKHICAVIENGGLVSGEFGTVNILDYKEDTGHDLCMVHVLSNLHEQTFLSKNPPEEYEESIIVGHPHLLPTMITRGNFSDTITVPVIYGYRDCTPDESVTPICLFMGKVPLIKMYPALVTSSLSMSGSSGSPVFNSKGQLETLVFAGEGDDLGFALTVPNQYIHEFLRNNYKIAPIMPKNVLGIAKATSSNLNKKLQQFCDSDKSKDNDFVCQILDSDAVWR